MGCPHDTPLDARDELVLDHAVLAMESCGVGPTVVLLHAGVADLRSWRETARALHGRHVIAYDRRGFGSTTHELTSHDDVDDLIAVLDHFGVEDVALVGNSQGGRVVLDALLDRRLRGRVRGAVLLAPAISGAPAPPDDWVPPEVVELDRRGDEAFDAGDIAAANEAEAHMWLDGPLQAQGRVGGCARELFLDMNRLALEAELRHPTQLRGDRPDAWPRLEEIDVAISVAVGELDLRLARERALIVTERIPGATFTQIDGVAHLPSLERPGQTAELASVF